MPSKNSNKSNTEWYIEKELYMINRMYPKRFIKKETNMSIYIFDKELDQMFCRVPVSKKGINELYIKLTGLRYGLES